MQIVRCRRGSCKVNAGLKFSGMERPGPCFMMHTDMCFVGRFEPSVRADDENNPHENSDVP